MNVLVAGDSWGVGVYQKTNDDYSPTGQGIHTFIPCQNVSKPGISNTEIINNIQRADASDITVFLQTDILREYSYHGPKGAEPSWRWLSSTFIQRLLTYTSLEQYITEYFSSMYTRLNRVAAQRNQQILCVGGWSDLHPSISNYSNLVPVIYSSTQTLIPNSPSNVYISDFEYFIQFDETAISNHFGAELKQLALASSKKFELSCQHWDDVHPNLISYEVLAKIIQKYLL
jgi:hypothetical protein